MEKFVDMEKGRMPKSRSESYRYRIRFSNGDGSTARRDIPRELRASQEFVPHPSGYQNGYERALSAACGRKRILKLTLMALAPHHVAFITMTSDSDVIKGKRSHMRKLGGKICFLGIFLTLALASGQRNGFR